AQLGPHLQLSHSPASITMASTCSFSIMLTAYWFPFTQLVLSEQSQFPQVFDIVDKEILIKLHRKFLRVM
ncbi:hypothetical protein PJJ89_29105, partial [Mycobacterium kansasii]